MKGILIKENLTPENLKLLERLSKMTDEEILLEMKVPPVMHKTIIKQIEAKVPIKIWYDEDLSWRIIEPHCYGLHKSTKNFVLRQYQVKGYSKSGITEGWKLFLVDKIRKVEFTNIPSFETRPDYNPRDKHMLVIIQRI